MQSLKELIEKKHLKERIIFNGKIQNSLLPKYFHEANVFVQPSLYEPFGITALEAISTGTPIVASRTGGLVELVQDKKNGFLCEPNNSNDLAKKVLLAKKVFTKNSTHSKIINKFEITKVIKRLNAFYAGIKGGNA
ncbi:MAG: glycosyltransferase [Candidatus Diapherotrites archaeon]|nr:glycosyltransferase [Candidatus Diapherotrites archaeon]